MYTTALRDSMKGVVRCTTLYYLVSVTTDALQRACRALGGKRCRGGAWRFPRYRFASVHTLKQALEDAAYAAS